MDSQSRREVEVGSGLAEVGEEEGEGEEVAEWELVVVTDSDLIAEKPPIIVDTQFAFGQCDHHEVEFVVLESTPPQHHLPLREITNNEVKIENPKKIS